MKLAKMSLAAALLLGANAYAIDNVKVNGDAKVYYGTADMGFANSVGDHPDIFDKDASYADTALHLGITADLTEGVSAGASVTAVSTLGLENNLVSGTWSSAHSASVTGQGASFLGDHSVDDEMWVGEAWIAGTAFDTTLKAGRQAIDTPWVFTETWGIDQNTFEAALLINQSISDTTLIAGWIGKSNGSADDTTNTLNGLGAAQAGYVSEGGKFNTFGKDGAYVAGAVNNSWKPLTAQAWYYGVQGLAKAYWVQADLDIEGILAGAQYANVDPEQGGLNNYLGGGPATTDDTSAYSLMIGYAMKDVVTVKAAYSSVDDSEDAILGMANAATGDVAMIGGQSKLYTEMWWNYGQVSAVGADSFSISAEATPFWEVDLYLGYYYSEIDKDGVIDNDEVTEIAFTASRSFGPLDTSLAIIYDDFDTDRVKGINYLDDMTTVQVYLTYNF